MNNKFFLAAVLCCVALLFACGGGGSDSSLQGGNSPQDVAQKFIQSMDKKNIEEAKTYCTPQTAEYLDMMLRMGGYIKGDQFGENVALRDSIVGDVAFVFPKSPQNKAQAQGLRLVKSDGQWLVDFAP